MVRCFLGHAAIAEKKLDHGNPLEVLGVDVSIDSEGISFQPNSDKRAKWSHAMEEALRSQRSSLPDRLMRSRGSCSVF